MNLYLFKRMMAPIVSLLTICMSGGCSVAQPTVVVPKPSVRIDLLAHGLPKGFFQADADTKCADHIIGYRFVVWLDNDDVAIGFNTSPNCRPSSNRKVDGSARVLVFDGNGALKATRDLPYLADAYQEIVAPGEAGSGPDGTLLFRVESVNLDKEGAHESKSGVRLLDVNLKDVAQIDGYLEQTTFVRHALVFQKGFTMSGPRTYSFISGSPPVETKVRTRDWPTGTLDKKFGDFGAAYMLCEQELRRNAYSSTDIIYAGANRRCKMEVEPEGKAPWFALLRPNETAAIVGLLGNGTVVGQINTKGSAAGQVVVWKSDGQNEILPWIPDKFSGSIQSATSDMARYAAFATNDESDCEESRKRCTDSGRLFVFDHRIKAPIVDRTFPKNGRAALSPDGTRYASLEAGELRIYPLPKSD